MISGEIGNPDENHHGAALAASATDVIAEPPGTDLASQRNSEQTMDGMDDSTHDGSSSLTKTLTPRSRKHEYRAIESPQQNTEQGGIDASAATPTSLTMTPDRNGMYPITGGSPPPVPQSKPLTLDDTRIENGLTISPLKPSNLIQKSRDAGRALRPPPGLPFMESDENDIGSNDDFLLYAPSNSYHSRSSDILRELTLHDSIGDFKKRNSVSGENRAYAATDQLTNNLFSLPFDTLHSVATFLHIGEWMNFGLVNRDAAAACRAVLRKVKMHAFYCAVEVLGSWSRGEYADAEELAALYVVCGVPIYPAPLGHAYHSIHWRMKVEIEKMRDTNNKDGNGDNTIDRFYVERHEARHNGDYYFNGLSFLEEKGLFWKSRQFPPDKRSEAMRQFNFHQLLNGMNDFHNDEEGGIYSSYDQDDDSQQRQQALGVYGAYLGEDAQTISPPKQTHQPKMVLYCHTHLIDRHMREKAVVCDEMGSIDAPAINLSADFFHPLHKKGIHETYAGNTPRGVGRPPSRQSRFNNYDTLDSIADNRSSPPQSKFFKVVEHGIISELELHSYDSKTGMFNSNDSHSKAQLFSSPMSKGFASRTSLDHFASITQRYEQKILTLLRQRDYSGADDCMIDFWDEFLPTTNTVHFFDKYTPVPRMSKLHTFLTRPCPKAFGTVQCEIERVRVRYRKKGMMTGRYYYTYEYRLFVTDRRLVDSSHPKNDTLLMTAKYRGKHFIGESGVTVSKSCGKKGVNHYFLYMPQQSDIDDHFEYVNKHFESNSKSHYRQREPDPRSKMELTRLQTNYLGTEFQISSPFYADTDANNANGAEPVDVEAESTVTGPDNSRPSKLSHRLRLKKKEKRKKNNSQKPRSFAAKISPFSNFNKKNIVDCGSNDSQKSEPVPTKEQEIGAITYTANVLGNRPRMMNVNIPKVSDESELPIAKEDTWIKNPGEEGQILRKLKSQQGNQDQDSEDNASENSVEDAYDLTSLRNRQPWWNVDLGAFVLNFGGRVSVASVKNFQLCDANDHENNHDSIMLQFGRIEGRHSFNMDFSYPLSPVQAFAISISSLQSKISFA